MTLVLVPPRPRTGMLHLADGAELPVSACYPARMYRRRGEDPLGALAWDGGTVRLGPNEHPDNLNVHVRAAYDIAAFALGEKVKPLPGSGTSTIVTPATLAVDCGYHIGITLRVGTEALNWTTIASVKPYRSVDDFELIDAHMDRVLTMVRWLESEYRQHGPFVRALELVSTKDRRSASRIARPLQITARQVQVLMRELRTKDRQPVAA